jgi:hydrogenase expression/formation protein HypE
LFKSRLDNPMLGPLADAAICPAFPHGTAFTTDSFVVSPLFFPGGDIGKLSVCGTVNDLAVMGAVPKFLSLAMILEEGLEIGELERIVDSIAGAAKDAAVCIVTGDTKVVEKGKGDRVFINTSGIGAVRRGFPVARPVAAGDAVLVSGSLGDHGAVIMSCRSGIALTSDLVSDCAAVAPLVDALHQAGVAVKFMRDPTRGGLAAVLNELAASARVAIEIEERAVPVKAQVRGICELLGIEALHLACEGRVVAVVEEQDAGRALAVLRALPAGREAASIGRIVAGTPGRIVEKTAFGGRRIVDMPLADPLPRIC